MIGGNSNPITRNLKSISQSVLDMVDYVDIPYYVVRTGKPSVIHQGSVLINTYKIWLQSDSTDYHRNYGYGGFLESQEALKRLDPSKADTIKQNLIDMTAEKFPDINLLSCDVVCVPENREWRIKVSVYDKTTGLTGLDMIKNDEVILYKV